MSKPHFEHKLVRETHRYEKLVRETHEILKPKT